MGGARQVKKVPGIQQNSSTVLRLTQTSRRADKHCSRSSLEVIGLGCICIEAYFFIPKEEVRFWILAIGHRLQGVVVGFNGSGFRL